jgi:hypothetical protein
MFGEEAVNLSRLFSVEGGEAVWLVHAALVLLFVLGLLALWYSRDPPRKPGAWRFEF